TRAGRRADVARASGDREQRKRERQDVWALSVLDERDETPGWRQRRAGERGCISLQTRKQVRDRRQEDERERRERRRDAGARGRACGNVESRGSERVTGRGHETVRGRNVVDQLADDGDEPRKKRRVEPLERKPQIPERIPGEVRKVIDDETRVGDVRGLDAPAIARELSGEEGSDEERLEREECHGDQ